MARWRIALALLLAAHAASSCHSKEAVARTSEHCTYVASGFGPPGLARVRVEVVAKGLEVPWGIAFLPGGDMLVTERPGRVVRLSPRGDVIATVATFPKSARGEGGLLGLALHPDFAHNRLFYVYVTRGDSDSGAHNRVQRLRLDDDGNHATLDRVILDQIPAAEYHDGGRLRFGPDGMLYVGVGDARNPDEAQDPTSPNGKLLRVDPDGGIPADNPFPHSPVFLLGVRNTEGFDWLDPSTLVVTDHGPSGELGRRGHDEVNIARAGQNLGWPAIYGCEERAGMVSPSLCFREAAPPGGAAIYTGTAIPEWRGSLVVGTLGSKHLHVVRFDDARSRRVARHEVYFQGDPPNGFGRLREVVMGPDAELYVTTSNCDGRGTCPTDRDRILRITR